MLIQLLLGLTDNLELLRQKGAGQERSDSSLEGVFKEEAAREVKAGPVARRAKGRKEDFFERGRWGGGPKGHGRLSSKESINKETGLSTLMILFCSFLMLGFNDGHPLTK
eukprot:scaffold129675_cov14-Tisochrysis_lutea.AAC.1